MDQVPTQFEERKLTSMESFSDNDRRGTDVTGTKCNLETDSNYPRQSPVTKKYNWHTHPQLREAVKYIIEGDSYYKAQRKTGLGSATIKKFYLKHIRYPEIYSFEIDDEDIESQVLNETELDVKVFTAEQEETLMKCFKDFEHNFYGLSQKECRMLAHQMVVREDMKIPAKWKQGMASASWLTYFRARHSRFMKSLEKPDRMCTRYKIRKSKMNAERNVILEKKSVTTFYDDLEKCFRSNPELQFKKRIYCLDEAYTSINPEKRIVDRESRSELLTTCCFICEDGTTLPPVVIKPYLPFDVCSAIPPGAIALQGPRGRMTADLFTEAMYHFVKHSHSSKTNPSILIMDTDLCHLSYAAFFLAEDSGVHIVTLHPHVSQLVHPMHGEIFDKFYKSYYDAMETWCLKLGEETKEPCDLGAFVNHACNEALRPQYILEGFKKCGISPFDRDLFNPADYLSCLDVVDRNCIECRLRDTRSRNEISEKHDRGPVVPIVEPEMQFPEPSSRSEENPNSSEEIQHKAELTDNERMSSCEEEQLGSKIETWNSNDIVPEILKLRKLGYTYKEIAVFSGFSTAIIYERMRDYYNTVSDTEVQDNDTKDTIIDDSTHIFTPQQEHEIVKEITQLKKKQTCRASDIGEVIYNYVVKNNIKHHFRKSGVGVMFVRRFLKKHGLLSCYSAIHGPMYKKVFTAEQEAELVNILKTLALEQYRVTSKVARKVAYNYAVKNNIEHVFKDGAAGNDWFRRFVKRNELVCVGERNREIVFPEQTETNSIKVGYKTLMEPCYEDILSSIKSLNDENFDEFSTTNDSDTFFSQTLEVDSETVEEAQCNLEHNMTTAHGFSPTDDARMWSCEEKDVKTTAESSCDNVPDIAILREQGCTYKEIANVTGLSVSTVHKRAKACRIVRGSEEPAAGVSLVKKYVKKHGATRSAFTTIFTNEQEAELATIVNILNQKQCRVTPRDVIKLAIVYAAKNNIHHKFMDGAAGYDWFHRFVKRNGLVCVDEHFDRFVRPDQTVTNSMNEAHYVDEVKQRNADILSSFRSCMEGHTQVKIFMEESQCNLEEHTTGDTNNIEATGDGLTKDTSTKEPGNMSPSERKQSGSELDKLKRRLIRSVARLIKEKKTEDEVWDELKKECGSNCRTLWVKMKSLTLKKLKRLFDAEDRNDSVPAVARMTLTDWLLYDLVLVHEKIDVIDRNSKSDSLVLNNLFSLVQRFEIEGRSGDNLAEAWTAATVSYNSKGHHCSPMLMQRRWYQLKELTRHKLYQFWFTYRGNERQLTAAKQDPPTTLQRAVALRYPDIITHTFPTWEERIELKLVVMPEEFEIKMRKKDLMKPSDEAVPDLVIVEQKIDTITVDSDSDFENDANSDAAIDPEPTNIDEPLQTPIIIQVKTEPEDPYDNIDITEHPVYPEGKQDRFKDAIESLQLEEENITMSQNFVTGISQGEECLMPLITSVTGAVEEIPDVNECDIQHNETEVKVIQDIIVEKEASEVNKDMNVAINTFDDNSQESIVIDDDDDVMSKDTMENRSVTPPIAATDNNVVDITSPEAKRAREYSDMIISSLNSNPDIRNELNSTIVLGNCDQNDKETTEDILEDIIKMIPEKQPDLDTTMVTEPIVISDGFEFADDGIEYDEEPNERSESNGTPADVEETQNSSDDNVGTQKFDLKLLMNPVVYTTRLDEMKVYQNRSLFETVEDRELVDKILVESKPVSTKSTNVDKIEADYNEEVASDDIDVKLEGSKVDYDLIKKEDSDTSDSEISSHESIKRIKLSNSLLRKPRSRSYNTIQLCKNPDFNTRLKRLNIGFYSYERNRVFLKACKPATIDLSKAFESKLINGTMYLEPNDQNVKTDNFNELKDQSESAASVVPSTVAVQSLMDNTHVDKILQNELQKRILERNKTIHLPNITLVRRINEQLLMAEVAPLISNLEKSANEIRSRLTPLDGVDTQNKIVPSKDSETVNLPTSNIDQPQLTPTVRTPDELTNLTPNLVLPTAPVSNNDNLTKGRVENVTYPLLPMLNIDKSKDDTSQDKQKKKLSRTPSHFPRWLKTINYNPNEENLLTLDTLYKVLNALDPNAVDYRSKTKTNQNKIIHPRSGKPKEPKSTKGSNQDSIDVITIDTDNQIEPPSTNFISTDEIESPLISTKIKGKHQRNCCWARSRINKINCVPNTRLQKHKCPKTHCRCCCSKVLRQVEIDNEIKLLQKMQNGDKCDETIEQVIQQSRMPFISIVEPTKEMCVKPQPAQVKPKRQPLCLFKKKSPMANTRNPNTFKENTRSISQAKRVSVGTQADNLDDSNSVTVLNYTFQKNSEIQETIDLVDDDVTGSDMQTPTPKIRVWSGTSNVPEAIKPSNREDTQSVPKVVPSLITLKDVPTSVAPKVIPTLMAPKVSVKENTVKETVKIPHLTPIPAASSENGGLGPCTCRPNVGIDKLSSMLVVDGSNVCKQHTKSRVSTETRIYLNRKHMSGGTRPFFVGKNKILLTTVTPQSVPPAPPQPEQVNAFEVPAGVQIVLLPDGTISYLLEPGVLLTPTQLKNMPTILNIIQEQIKASGITLPKTSSLETTNTSTDLPNSNDCSDVKNDAQHNENVDTIAQKSESEKVTSNAIPNQDITENQTESATATESQTEPELEKMDVDQEKLNNVDDTSKNQIDIEKDVNKESKEEIRSEMKIDESEHMLSNNMDVDIENNVSNISDISTTEHSVNSKTVENTIATDNDPTSKTKSYTSSPEENVPVQEPESEDTNNKSDNENSNNTLPNPRNLLSDLMEMSGILDDVQPETASENSSVDVAQDSSAQLASPDAQVHIISALINDKTYKLSPVTSFADLKYACDNKGLFFKLDLDTGLIVPINVCIQKTPGINSAKKNISSEVIDLTDADEAIAKSKSFEKESVTIPNIEDNQSLPSPVKISDNPKNKPLMLRFTRKNLLMPHAMPSKPMQNQFVSQIIENQAQVETNIPTTITPMKLSLLSPADRKTALMKRLSNNLKPLKIKIQQRNPINILKKSSLLQNTSIVKRLSNLRDKTDINTADISESSDDDSEDEPLAKIAKKMRSGEDDGNIEAKESQELSQREESQELLQSEVGEDNVDFEERIDAMSSVDPPTTFDSQSTPAQVEEPVPTHLVLSGSAVGSGPLLANMNMSLDILKNTASDEDSDGEDCILGF